MKAIQIVEHIKVVDDYGNVVHEYTRYPDPNFYYVFDDRATEAHIDIWRSIQEDAAAHQERASVQATGVQNG